MTPRADPVPPMAIHRRTPSTLAGFREFPCNRVRDHTGLDRRFFSVLRGDFGERQSRNVILPREAFAGLAPADDPDATVPLTLERVKQHENEHSRKSGPEIYK